MKRLYSILGFLLAAGFLITSYSFITKSVEASKAFKNEKNKVAEILNFNDRLLSFQDWVFTQDAWNKKKRKFEKVLKEADQNYNRAQKYGEYLLYTCLIFFVLIVAIYAKKRIYYGLTFGLTFVGMVLLGQGIANPILEMSAFKEELTIKVYVHPDDIPYFESAVDYLSDVNKMLGGLENGINVVRMIPIIGDPAAEEIQAVLKNTQDYLSEGENYLKANKNNPIGFDKVFPGKTYFYYQNKGILDVISLLIKNNFPVAIAIGAFSILIPFVKLLFTLFLLIFSVKGAKRLRKVLSFIAKWSMADVFVVAAFLAYLSFSNMSPGVQMDAKVLFGLYYFMGYVLISILLGPLLNQSIQERQKSTENVKIES